MNVENLLLKFQLRLTTKVFYDNAQQMINLLSSSYTVQNKPFEFHTLMTYEKNLSGFVGVLDEIPLVCELEKTFEVVKTLSTR